MIMVIATQVVESFTMMTLSIVPSELPDGVVKGVSRLAVQVVQNYTDGPSRVRLRELIFTLAKKHGTAVPALASSFLSQAQHHSNVPHST